MSGVKPSKRAQTNPKSILQRATARFSKEKHVTQGAQPGSRGAVWPLATAASHARTHVPTTWLSSAPKYR